MSEEIQLEEQTPLTREETPLTIVESRETITTDDSPDVDDDPTQIHTLQDEEVPDVAISKFEENQKGQSCSCLPENFKEGVIMNLRLMKLVLFRLLRPSWHLSIAQFFIMIIPLVTLYFLGRRSPLHLKAGIYAFSFANIIGFSIIYAMTSAVVELCAKAQNINSMCVILQKTFIMWFLYCLSITSLTMNSAHIMYFINEDAELAKYVEDFCAVFTPGLFLLGICFLLQIFMVLVKPGSIWPLLVSNLFTAVLNACLNFALPGLFPYGIRSAALAADLSFACLLVILVLWIMWTEHYRSAWTGVQWECLEMWRYLALKLLLQTCLVAAEWWVFDICTFVLGSVNEEWLVPQAVGVFILHSIFTIFKFFSMAASSQVQEAVHETYYRRAVFILKATVLVLWLLALASGTLLTAIRDVITTIFIDDDFAAAYAEDSMPLMGIFPFLKATQVLGFYISSRVNHSKMQQAFNYGCVFICQTVVGLLIGMSLLFYAKRGMNGLWSGLLIGMILQLFIFLALLYKNMQEWTDKAEFVPVQDNLYNEDDLDDVDGKSRGTESLLLHQPHIHTRINSVTILPGAEPRRPQFGDGLMRLRLLTILFRFLNITSALTCFVLGFVCRFVFDHQRNIFNTTS